MRFLLATLVWGGWLAAAAANVTLPDLESAHMVLQRSDRTALWGTADPGETVTATLTGVTGAATAGPDGKWRVELDLSHVDAGPFDLVVAGNNTLTVPDVVVGEVWVASGQSNMEFQLAWSADADAEIPASANPFLRQFHVGNDPSLTPQDRCRGAWVQADPSTTGSFTAVGYHFAKRLHQTLHAPVGLILSAVGGTPCEAWTSLPGLQSEPGPRAASERFLKEAADYPGLKADYLRAYHAWETRYDRAVPAADPTAFLAPDLAGWRPMALPGKLRDASLPDAGVVWLRKVVTLHGEEVKRAQGLDLADLNGYETVYYNGKKVAEVTPDSDGGVGAPKRYWFGGSVDGENVFLIRIYNPTGDLGIGGAAERLTYGSTRLAGEWLGKAEAELPPLSDEARQARPTPPKAIPPLHLEPAALYNGMIHPLTAATVAGAVWYQGESNASRAAQYQDGFRLLIQSWRQAWGRELPFYFCQLPAFGPKKAGADEYTSWAEMRAAQTATLALPNTGQAVLIDLGESDDIHPRDKRPVGERLAGVTLVKHYGQTMPSSGPVYEACKVEGGAVRVTFRGDGGALVARPLPETYVKSSLRGKMAPLVRNRPGSELEGFAIRGAAHGWVWADARIEHDTVVVSHPDVPHPTAVRYAWANTPTVNLYDEAGLPAAPFSAVVADGN